MPESTRVIVTGVAGFIGSHLAEGLVKRGFLVWGIDSFTDYYPRSIKERNTAWLCQQTNFRLVEGDLLTADLSSMLEGIAVVYHLAGQPGVRGSWGQNFQTYVRNNLLSTQRLLETAFHSGRPRIVYASSSSVYGNIAEMPLREEMAPSPVSPYGVTKLAAEHLCRLYAQVHGMDTVSLRLFTVYGPRQRPEMAFCRFIHAMLNDESIPLYGDGEQTRDVTYIDDVVQAFLLALTRGRSGDVFNVAGGARVTINEVLAQLAAVTGRTPRISQLPPQAGDVQHTWASVDRVRRVLGYTPTVGLAEGLKHQVEFVRNGMDAESL